LTEDERERFRENAKHYVEAARIYRDDAAGIRNKDDAAGIRDEAAG
jgi:hypothetical protein